MKQKEFLEKARAIHGDIYDYSKVDYKNNKTKICIICPEHGEFWQEPSSHLKGRGCPKCGKEKIWANRKRDNTESIIERIREVHGDKYDYSKVEYVNMNTKICIICHNKDSFGNEHGEFWVKPFNFINGSKCPKCNNTRWTTESFIARAKQIHGNKYDYSKTQYVDSRTKVCIICHDLDKYGNEVGEFWQYPLLHLDGCGCEREKRGEREECWEIRTCPICGKEFKIRKKYEKICCSEECRKKYCEIHSNEISEKKSFAMREIFKNKSKEDILKEQKKRKETCFNKYGKEHYSQTEEGRRISSEIMKRWKKEYDEKYKYNVLIPKYQKICEDNELELLEFRNRFDCTVKCKKCGDVFTATTLGYLRENSIANSCRICHPIEQFFGPTKLEDEFEEFLKELRVTYYKNYRKIISPQEIDFYLPEYKIGFELNGLYWHCEEQKPDHNYHLMKTEKCYNQEIQLIHIFEDEWLYKRDICKSIIRSKLNLNKKRIGARQCIIKEINRKDCKDFINNHHIQGFIGFQYGFGLYYENELVMVMTIGKLRKNLGNTSKEGEYEILRICCKDDITISGGASKLLKYFIKKYKPNRIITYADRRWSNGDVYDKLGFTFKHNTKPNYYYIIENTRKNRFGFRKSVLVEKYGCPQDKTEKEFCREQKWYRIYDCGSKAYEMILA